MKKKSKEKSLYNDFVFQLNSFQDDLNAKDYESAMRTLIFIIGQIYEGI